MVHVSMPPQKFNEAVRAGSAAKKLARIVKETKPEAASCPSIVSATVI